MGNGGQRQDINFLALVVAVLAVGLAVFVGMRSGQKERRAKPQGKAAAAAPKAAPVAVPPAGEAKRDPFKKDEAGAAGEQGKQVGGAQALKLVGIVREQGAEPTAVIRSATKRYYAGVGARAAGYTVVSIGEDQAVLERDGNRVTLLLREPEPEE